MRGSLAVAFVLAVIAADASVDGMDADRRNEPERRVDFERDVLPILERSCHECHGPDRQKGGYRLDVRATALAGGDSGSPPIVPGDAAASPLVAFISGMGDLTMPPNGDPLSTDEIDLVRDWIDQGAEWPDGLAGRIADPGEWWAFRRLERPDLPTGTAADSHPVDAFVAEKRRQAELPDPPAADRRTLIRRVSYDLTGLPPTPSEVAGFVNDPSPDAYLRLVERLLASPRYGERQARLWMDAIHFAETHGHDQDRIRENAWPYRDYLIDAFNADRPWSRMILEQVAGDALYPDDPKATVALGFLAAGPWDESSLRDIREDTLDRAIGRSLDRDDMLGTVINNVTSLTVQCARCHNHKFDPITQADYYALQAVFAGVERADRRYDDDPLVHRRRQELLDRKRAIERREPELMASFISSEGRRRIVEWEAHRPAATEWKSARFVSATSVEGVSLERLADGSILCGGIRPERDDVTLTFAPDLGTITAVRLEVLSHESLPHAGPGRQDNGNLHLSEIRMFSGSTPIELCHPIADFNQTEWGIEKAADGNPQTAWGIYPQVGRDHEAIFELQEPLHLDDVGELKVVLWQRHGSGHLIGRLRITFTADSGPFATDIPPADISLALETPAARRSEDDWTRLGLFIARDEVDRELTKLPPVRFVYAAASDFEPNGGLKPPPGPRPIHILHRGDIRQPREPASPGAIACVADLPARFDVPPDADESARRAALAHWLVDRRNPLTWRSIVNRVWQQHFDRGLVATPNDFGHMGEPPTHPELLDWLAVTFRDSDHSLKRLHRLLVTSDLYCAASSISPSERVIEVDPLNRLLWRAPRRRLDAESIRDALLAISGRLDLRMGGPSDRQFSLQPGIHVTPTLDYAAFDLDSDAGRRRSVYRFLFRTLPDPFMEALDCPAGDQFTPTRSSSVTVQQALAMWNDAFMLRQCEHLAVRLEHEATDPPARVTLACELAWGRPPAAEELASLVAYADRHGLANLCRLIVNTNEFLFLD